MPTKQEIIAELSLLSLSKLERLQKYANYLIIPEEDLLTNVTMIQMMNKVEELALTYFPEWTDRSASDFGTFLVELMAIFSEKDFWYINSFYNQSQLLKMSLYSSAFIRAVELGARPTVTVPSRALFSLTFAAGDALDILPGEIIIQLATGEKFTNFSTISLAYSVSPTVGNYLLVQGEYSTETFTFNGKQVDLRKPRVAISLIELSINGDAWTRVPVFGQSGPDSLHYIVFPEEDGRCSIFFGEDGYGKTPAIGTSVTIKYLTCKGSSADGLYQASFATINKSNALRRVTIALISEPTYGGTDAFTLAKLKQETVNYVNYRKACLNETAIVIWLNEQPEVSKSYAYLLGTTVAYTFVNKSGVVPSTEEQDAIAERLVPLISNGLNLSYSNTTFQDAAPVVADVYYLVGFNPDEIISSAKQLIQDYTDPIVLCDYGKDFDLSDINVLLRGKIPGFQNIVFGTPSASISIIEGVMLTKLELSDITLTAVSVS